MGPMDAQLNECGTMLDWMRASDRMHELADERFVEMQNTCLV